MAKKKKWKPNRTGRAFFERLKWGWLVGFDGPEPGDDSGYQYHGPRASVSYDSEWLHISTDDCEGHAMLNIEALPQLRKVLAQIAKERRAIATGNSAPKE